MRIFRKHAPSPALVVSVVALIVALGGTSYAAFSLPKNSVGTKQLKNGSVTTKKLKNKSITRAKLNLKSLGAVPSASFATSARFATNASHASDATRANSATTATTATNAGFATTAGTAAAANALNGVQYVASSSVPNPVLSQTAGSVNCPAGTYVLGGGAAGSSGLVPPAGQSIVSSYPLRTSGSSYPNAWEVAMNNASAALPQTFTVYAICATVANSTSSFTRPAAR